MRFSVNSNTTQQLNFNELLEKVVGSGALPQNKMGLISYIAELISNVYEHSTSEQQSSVDWCLSIYHENNELFLTVHDNGQGIESSLKNKRLSTDEPLRFAVESCVGNRGQGLRSIYEATKLIRETVDMNKSVIIIGKKEEDIQNKFKKDKVDLKNILEITNKVLEEEISGKDIEEFHRLGRYEGGKNRPIKVTFQSTNMMEEVLRKANKLHEEDEFKNVFIRRCLNREDRELLRGKLEEAKAKNAERSDEEAQVFFLQGSRHASEEMVQKQKGLNKQVIWKDN